MTETEALSKGNDTTIRWSIRTITPEQRQATDAVVARSPTNSTAIGMIRNVGLAVFVMINGSCMRSPEPPLPESSWQQSGYPLPKIADQDVLFRQMLEVDGAEVECTFFEQRGELRIRIEQREFRILGTTKPDGTPVEFSPELVRAARQSFSLESQQGVMTFSAEIPFVLTGKFRVHEKDIAASLAQLSGKVRGQQKLCITVSSGSLSVMLYGDIEYNGTQCALRAEEVRAQVLLAQQ